MNRTAASITARGHAPTRTPASHRVLALAAIVAAFLWAHWATLTDLVHDWDTNDNYSVGLLVPPTALYLLWLRRRQLAETALRPCWWGAVVIGGAQAARLFALAQQFPSGDRYAMVLSLVGLVLLMGGVALTRQVGWILAFLFLMVPLPNRLHNAISLPMQELATTGAVVLLELLGTVVVREGNVMLLNGDTPVAVAEACSGLRMLTAFVVVAAFMAFVLRRPAWQRIALVASSVPIAIVCNLVRLVATAELFVLVSSDIGERFFHDFAGLTMMPLAVLMLVGELWLFSVLVEDPRRVASTSV
jgi:exosortase